MDKNHDHFLSLFIRWTRLTLVFVFLVICAGAVVRATGSGMGCPDWPKCFGSWVPPTDVSQLPPDYKEQYAKGEVVVEEFNAAKTWTEYINRLLGALLGIIAFIAFVVSLRLRRIRPYLMWGSLLVLVLIGFEGWLGKTVVDSNLAPARISLHMSVALIIMTLCLMLIHFAAPAKEVPIKKYRTLLIILLTGTLLQIILGVKVREQVDTFSSASVPSSSWIDLLDTSFLIHRSFAILLLLFQGFLWIRMRKSEIGNVALACLALMILEACTGVLMNYLGFPFLSQPVHLVMAAGLFALQSTMFVRTLSGSSQ